MSTDVLHSSNNAHKADLLEKIGGTKVLHAAVDDFYERLVKDQKLKVFFDDANMTVLKWHQFNIMSIAFSPKPESLDVEHFILTRHKKMFDDGLNEKHFDIVMKHFEATFKELKVDQHAIDEAKVYMSPFRESFKNGAEEAKVRVRRAVRRRQLFWLAAAGVVAVTAYLFNRNRSSKRIR